MDASSNHDTFVIERTFAQPPARVFAAFADPGRKRRWFAAGASHDVEEFSMDFVVGGREQARYRMRPGTPLPGAVIARDGAFLDIVPGHRIVAAASMSVQGQPISVSLETYEFIETPGGTRLVFTHQAVFFPGADGPAMRRGGWDQLLGQLAGEVAHGD